MDKKYRILLVEDEPILAFTEQILLTNNGYEVQVVNSGEDAIKIIKEDSFINLILMDIDLGPGIDGTEAAKSILKIKEIPIIFYTSHTEKNIVEKVKEITRYGLVSKTSGPYILLSSIEMAIDLFETKQKLVISERRWNVALSETLSGVCDWNLSSNEVYYSPQWKSMLGYSESEIGTGAEEWMNRIHDEDLARVKKEFDEFKKSKAIQYSSTYRLKHKDGGHIWIQDQSVITEKNVDGTIERIVSVHRNITNEYLTQEKLRKISQHIPGVIYQFRMRTDGTSHFPYASDGIKDIYNVSPSEVELDSFPIFDQIHPDDISIISESIVKSRDELSKWNMIYRVRSGDSYKWVEGESSPERLEDGSTIWHGYIRELNKSINTLTSQSKNKYYAQENNVEVKNELIQSDKFYQLFDEAPISVFVADELMNYSYVNNEAAKLLGYTVDELQKLNVKDVSKDVSINESLFSEMIKSKKLTGSAKLKKKDGSLVETSFTAFEVSNSVYISFNISLEELKESKQRLENQREFYENLLDIMPLNIYTIDTKGAITFANKSILDSLNVSKDEILGKTAYDFYPIDDAQKYLRDDQQVIRSRKVLNTVENNVDPTSKKARQVKTIKSPIVDPNTQKVTGLVGIFYDVTAEMEANRQKEFIIQQKNTLLNEVHHRIKNNLSMLFGMMNLQAEMANSTEVAMELKSASSRIMAIGNLYDKIYQAKDGSEISLQDYLMDLQIELVKNIIPMNIDLEFDIDNVIVPEQKLLLIGVFINELITNSIKYGFPNKRQGSISVSIHQKAELIELTVEDTGIGLPTDVLTGQRKGFGLTMISSLLNTIRGELVLDTEYPNQVKIICKKD